MKQVKFSKHQNQQPTSQPAFTCSKLTIETLEQGVEYVLYVRPKIKSKRYLLPQIRSF